jgi:hypothetical protein
VIVAIDYTSCVWLNEDRPNGKFLAITGSFVHASIREFVAGRAWHILAENIASALDVA